MTHLYLHFIVPFIISKLFIEYFYINYSVVKKIKLSKFVIIWLCMMLTMLIDIDHLLATPIYQAGRCSVGFHPLHTAFPIVVYLLLCFPKKTRVFGVGLVIHIILDSFDCQSSSGVWFV